MNQITPKFVYDPKEVQEMTQKLDKKSIFHLLQSIVRSTQKLARPPLSNFHVSAAGVSSDGRIFIGVNMEFPNLPLHHSIHAEQFLITNFKLHQQRGLSHVVVSAYPCGHCRQFLQEIRGCSDIQIFVLPKEDDSGRENGYPDEENVCFKPLSCFLPHPFGPHDLFAKDLPLVLEDHYNNLVMLDRLNRLNHEIATAALEAANRSHAPYSNCPSGVAFIDDNGKIYRGPYMESAAYNPSMGPAQAAIVAYVVENGGGEGDGCSYERIVEGVLVEKEGALVRQEETVRLFVKAVLPNCVFNVVHCKVGSLVNDG